MSLAKRSLPGETKRGLDDPGKALRDRLLRLGSKKSSAYTALSLLKGYSSFKIGACLDLHNEGSYKSYAIVGLGIAKVSISLTGLLREDQAFCKIPHPESLDLQFVTPEMKVWIFALDDFDPCRRLLLAAEENGSAFNPETIASIISKTNEVFFPSAAQADPEGFDLELPGETEAPDPVSETETAGRTVPAEPPAETVETPEETRSKIAEYQHSNAVFQGILLEIPGGGKKSGFPFAKQVAVMVGVLGVSFALPSRRILILLPPLFDRELIAHRLSLSFATEVLSCFETDNPDKALEFIQPYL
ncbi:MAG: hypothetical protein LBU16_02360 [Treponema sp.]|jgi:hypothetical protein|nr:hypothetical protein [Treponema sp.]